MARRRKTVRELSPEERMLLEEEMRKSRARCLIISVAGSWNFFALSQERQDYITRCFRRRLVTCNEAAEMVLLEKMARPCGIMQLR